MMGRRNTTPQEPRTPKKIPWPSDEPTSEFHRITQSFFGLPQNGIFDDSLAVAIWRFQKSHRVQTDGLFGPASLRALLESEIEFPEKTYPETIEFVQWIIGVEITGNWNEESDQALREIQETLGLGVDGQLSSDTLDRLLIA